MKRLHDKVLGKVHVYQKGDGMFTRYLTTIRLNERDEYFISKLNLLGFTFIHALGGKATVILPSGWIHTRQKKVSETIIDDKGRKRMHIDLVTKNVILHRRYGYQMSFISTNNGMELFTAITDQGRTITCSNVTSETIEEFKMNHSCDDEGVMKHFEDGIKLFITEKFPDWENELAYWDRSEWYGEPSMQRL